VFYICNVYRFHQYSLQCGMTPSEYIKQMLMSTQERINYLLKPGRSINIRSLYDNCESHCFRVSPSIVLFQRFVPGNLYNVTLTIQNITKVNLSYSKSYISLICNVLFPVTLTLHNYYIIFTSLYNPNSTF